ncbi:MAG TPA: YhcN/YlaJ family sporulation lipoprotein [Candidatus Spyradocola merdavium]|nr:YhcN/YlaJ family sporulation lipoprotein [Candidatus Spyradocola merdavium]
MKRKLLLTLVFILATAALTACSCSISPGASPSPSPSALTATPSPTQSATASPSPMESAATTPGASATSPSPESSAQTEAAIDLDALAQEVEKLSEVSLCDVVAEGDRAVVGLSFDAQYQGTLTDRIEEMVREKITGIESAVIHIAVTADPTLCTEIKNLAQEVQGKPMTEEQMAKFDELYEKIQPAGTESSAA